MRCLHRNRGEREFCSDFFQSVFFSFFLLPFSLSPASSTPPSPPYSYYISFTYTHTNTTHKYIYIYAPDKHPTAGILVFFLGGFFLSGRIKNWENTRVLFLVDAVFRILEHIETAKRSGYVIFRPFSLSLSLSSARGTKLFKKKKTLAKPNLVADIYPIIF